MGIIQLLDTATTNKIAAGEVVADPASVVKELVENALDAGSTRITVETVSGGIGLIKVSDNGSGIGREDIETAFMRHATSKIRSFTDLDSVATMGFRGEALASIAAVAKVTLTTRLQGSNEGFEIRGAAGVFEKPRPVGCAAGTTIEVADLFYNVPARRKFLKSAARETAKVNEIVSRLAIGNPHVAVKLKNDGKLIFETYGNDDLLAAIAVVIGKGTAEHLVPLQSETQGWTIRGFVSTPFHTRSSRKSQYFYVNKRWVANPGFRYALDHAYRTMIPKGRYPVAVLFLETNAPLIDVNVDPTKNTVRISNEKPLLDFLTAAVRDTLSDNRRKKGINGVKGDGADGSNAPGRNYSYKQISAKQISAALDFLPHRIGTGTKADSHDPESNQSGGFSEGNASETHSPATPASPEPVTKVGYPKVGHLQRTHQAGEWPQTGSYTFETPGEPPGEEYPNEEHPAEAPRDSLPFKVLGQLAASFILYEQGQDLYIADQHAAHERIRYEAIANSPAREATQLVIPQTVELSPRQIALVEQLSEELENTGFQFEFFGRNFIVLREVPIELSFSNPEASFTELMELTEDYIGSMGSLRQAFLFSLACKTAVKAGQVLSHDEMEAIIEGLAQCREPWTCPHGRPTTVRISKEMLLKAFKRI